MKKHHYQITVAPLNGSEQTEATLTFAVSNHDAIPAIVERLRQRGDFPSDQAAALGVGLKLFGEVMLENRNHPLFAEIAPAFGQFMKKLKQGKAGETSQSTEPIPD